MQGSRGSPDTAAGSARGGCLCPARPVRLVVLLTSIAPPDPRARLRRHRACQEKREDALLLPRPHAGRQGHLPEPEEASRTLRLPALRKGKCRQGWQVPSGTAGLRPQQEQAQRLPRPGLDGPDTVRRRGYPDLWQALEHRGILQDVQILSEAGQRDEIHLLRRSDRSHVHCLRALYDARFRATAQHR